MATRPPQLDGGRLRDHCRGYRNAEAEVEQLKDDVITTMVEFGRAREAVSDSNRAKVDSEITSALSAAGSETWYETCSVV